MGNNSPSNCQCLIRIGGWHIVLQLEQQELLEYSVEPAYKEGGYTLAVYGEHKKRYILSKYYPKKEAIAQLKEDFGNRQTIWMLIGFGMGYMASEILNQVGEDVHIIIAELNEDLLQDQIEVANDLKQSNKPNVQFFIGRDAEKLTSILKSTIPKTELHNVRVVVLESYLTYYPEYCRTLLCIIDKYLVEMDIGINTAINLRRRGIQNTLSNRYAMQNGYDLSVHCDKYQGIPALIVSAGPSLNKNIHLIKEFKGIILCVGRTLSTVLAQGVKPDFVVSVDPSDKIYETFGTSKEHDIPLVTIIEGNDKVVKTSNGPRYFLYNSAVVSGILNLRVNPTLAMSGTVASLCLSTAHYMGCEPIVFIGQDLAYTDDKRHSTLASDNLIGLGDNNARNYIPEKEIRYIKSYDGGVVPSEPVLISFLTWIQNFIKENPNTYINATEGGAFIYGAQHMPLKECIERYCIAEKPEITHVFFKGNEKLDVDKNINEATINLKKILKLSKSIKNDYDQLITEYEKYKGINKSFIYKIMKHIETSDAAILKISNSETLIKILLEDIELLVGLEVDNKEPINEAADRRLVRNLRLNHIFYQHLENGIEQLIIIIKGAMKQ